MNSIVSATTSSIAGSGMRVGRRETFLSAAYELLAQAREEYDGALSTWLWKAPTGRLCGWRVRSIPCLPSSENGSGCPQARGRGWP